MKRRGFLAHALGVPIVAATAMRNGDLSQPALFSITLGQHISADQEQRMREVLAPYAKDFNCKFIIFQPDTTIIKITDASSGPVDIPGPFAHATINGVLATDEQLRQLVRQMYEVT